MSCIDMKGKGLCITANRRGEPYLEVFLSSLQKNQVS